MKANRTMHDGGDYAEYLRRVLDRKRQQNALCLLAFATCCECRQAKSGGNSMTMQSPILGVLGSARSGGNTGSLARAVFSHLDNAALIDLNSLAINPYSYDEAHESDDFHALAEKMTAARAIVFASPVYWYSMSAPMKTVFDRMTQMTDIYKPLGKSLAGKPMFVIGTGSVAAAPASFEAPFAETAGYFDMNWSGLLYVRGATVNAPETARAAKAFAENITAASAASAPLTRLSSKPRRSASVSPPLPQ